MNTQHIEPCPFCGADAELEDVNLEHLAVICCGCGAIGPREDFGDAAIRAWNARRDTVPEWLAQALNSGDGVYRP